MIISMTGFGTASGDTPLGNFQVDIKTVNARYLEFNFRLPSTLSAIEIPLRQLLCSRISRGKVDVFIKWDESEKTQPRVRINEAMVKDIVNQLSRISKKLGIQTLLINLEFFTKLKLCNFLTESFSIIFYKGIFH